MRETGVMAGLLTAGAPPVLEPPVLDVPAGDADRPRSLNARTLDDRLALLGSLAGSFSLVWVVFIWLAGLSGAVGFVVCWYLAFLSLYAGVTAAHHPTRVVVDRVMAAVVHLAALLVGVALMSVVGYTFWRARRVLPHLNLYTHDASGAGPRAPLTQGGVSHAIVGSFIQLSIAVGISLPLGIGTALFVTEVGGRFAKVVRTVVEAMTAIPDLLAGLFVYVTLIVRFHMARNGLAAALAIAVTMTPIIARSSEVALRVVAGGLREAGMALGATHWRTVARVVVPTARPGLATALILAVARGIGESAPLLIVSGASTFWNTNPLRNPMNSLPLYIYSGARSGAGDTLEIQRAFGAASVLLAIVFVLFLLTRVLARRGHR